MPDLKVLVLELDGQKFGFPLVCIREVLRAVWIEPLPGAPDVVEGIVNVRGKPVPVLSLRLRFGLQGREIHPGEHLVVAEVGTRTVAFRVDRATGVVSFPPELVAAASSLGPGVRHIDRVASDGDGLVFVHDPADFLSAAEQVALDASMREAP